MDCALARRSYLVEARLVTEGSPTKAVDFSHLSGFYEVRTPSQRTIHLLLDSDGKWRSGDWYSLRFFHMYLSGLLTPLEYDAGSWKLAVMADQRPPAVYERVLVLASGLMPTVRNDWEVYENINPDLAQEISMKLCMRLSEGGA